MAYVLARPLPSTRSTTHKTHVRTRSISQSSTHQTALPFVSKPRRGTQHVSAPPSPVLRMLMFGKPGAGKGTLSARLVKKYEILSLSTGDLLRRHIAEQTDVGKLAKEIVRKGELLPDEVVLKVVTSKLNLLKNKHWILDGFPRTLGQGELLDAHLKISNAPLSLVINLDVPDSVILERISDRWTHLPSGRIYNMSYNRPKVDGLDDVTGEKLVQRPDDNPETFARRLSQFYTTTSPLLSYYGSPANPTVLCTLKGSTSDEIWPQLDAAVCELFPGLKERQESRDTRRRHSLSDALLAEEGGRREEKESEKVGS